MRKDNQDVSWEEPVKNDAGELSLDEETKKVAFNVEYTLNPEDLSEETPVKGPSELITTEMITKAISRLSLCKAAGP